MLSHNQKILELLAKRQTQGTLGGLYIIQTGSSDFLNQFLQKILGHDRYQTQGHGDILWPLPSAATRGYKSEDLSELTQFCTHAPLQLPQKIMIIEQAHLLGELLCNKLLKVLEEPPVPLCFLFAHPAGHELIPTVQSRAVTFRLLPEFDPDYSCEYQQNIQDFLHSRHGVADLLEQARSSRKDALGLFKAALQQGPASASSWSEWSKVAQQFNTALAYNSSPVPFLFQLLMLLKPVR